MDPAIHLLTPFLLIALLGWSVLRRIRRSIGRQPLRPARLVIRAVILSAAMLLLLVVSSRHVPMLTALLGGLLGGAGLGLVSLQRTSLESSSTGPYYVPHAQIGLFITVLFVARVAWRFVVMGASNFDAPADPSSLGSYSNSPLTLGIFGVLAGYFVVYNLGLLRMSRRVAAPLGVAIGSDQ